MKKVFTLAFLLLAGLWCGAQNDNCFGIIVGKNASANGEVIFGHNEDDGGEQMLNLYASPEYIWAEFPGMETADAFMNRYVRPQKPPQVFLDTINSAPSTPES